MANAKKSFELFEEKRWGEKGEFREVIKQSPVQ